MDAGDKFGDYVIVKHLSTGGMAEVYLARMSGVGGFTKPVALKLMYLGGDKGPTIYEIAVNDTQLDAMERHLDALWATIDRAIERESFPPRPGPLCNWCSYQDICPAFADDVEGSTID